MRVLICGGRDFDDQKGLYAFLSSCHRLTPFTLVIDGAARGADTLAHEWATYMGIPTLRFPADWLTYGNKAGYIRNTQMLTEGKPDRVIAFPGGRGTADMVKQALAAKIPTYQAARHYILENIP